MRDGARPHGRSAPHARSAGACCGARYPLVACRARETRAPPRPGARRPVAAPESPPHAAAASPGPSGLARAVPRWHVVALMVNGIVGAGIFGLPSQVHALAGPWGLAAFVVCGAVVAAFALTFAEVASRFALTGGPYLYTRTAFGPLPGFLVGWLMWVPRVSAIAAIAAVMTSYLAFFWPPAAAGAGRAAATCVALAALTALNLVGVGRAARVAVAFTLAK